MKSNQENKVSTFSQVLLWFGAAVSIAEIITGALLAPLGLSKGVMAILIGHVIGAIILFLAGYIGAKSGLSSAMSAHISFGKFGTFGFSILNLLQLLGWTAIMIITASKAIDSIAIKLWNMSNETLWCIIICILICVWVLLSNKSLTKINTIVMLLLFILSLILGFVVFKGNEVPVQPVEGLSFGEAVELNVVMCLSWMPLIADYTRNLKKPLMGTVGSVMGYSLGSILMYTIGLGAALFAGDSDIGAILLAANLGILALLIVVLSTVTTTFLDVYSAGVSIKNLSQKTTEKVNAIIVCILGTLLAIFVSMSQYENFLYLIGSTFAPLFAVLFADYYILGQTSIQADMKLNVKSLVLWLIGLIGYRMLMPYNTPIGITLPVMVGIFCLSIITSIRREDGKWILKRQK